MKVRLLSNIKAPTCVPHSGGHFLPIVTASGGPVIEVQVRILLHDLRQFFAVLQRILRVVFGLQFRFGAEKRPHKPKVRLYSVRWHLVTELDMVAVRVSKDLPATFASKASCYGYIWNTKFQNFLSFCLHLSIITSISDRFRYEFPYFLYRSWVIVGWEAIVQRWVLFDIFY